MFDQFNKIEEENRDISGVGLRLHVTKALVELLGGTIEVISSVGKGTDIVVVIPQKIVSEKKDV